MKLTISAKNMELTEGLKSAVERKLSKLDKYFEPNIQAHVTLSVEKLRHIIEVTIPFNGVILRGEVENDDMYGALDLVEDKIEGQIRKQKTKLQKKVYQDSLKFKQIAAMEDREDEQQEAKIVKTKRFAFKPMHTEEAILQMELLGHNFFVYANGENSKVNVVYKRKDGNYGLIEPEF
jgi:putative sigma-54 modulation protein